MQPVTVYLRTALFRFDKADRAHVPPGVMAIRGTIVDRADGTLVVETAALLDHRGDTLTEAPRTLEVPLAKVDHILRG